MSRNFSRILSSLIVLLAALLCLAATPVASGAQAQQVQIDTQALTERIRELVNAERARQGLAPLAANGVLDRVAADHAMDMAERDYFSHVNPEGQDATARAAEEGYTCQRTKDGMVYQGLGENLSQTWAFSGKRILSSRVEYQWRNLDEIARTVVQQWMASPDHRKNVLDPVYEVSGIGVAAGGEAGAKIFIVQTYC